MDRWDEIARGCRSVQRDMSDLEWVLRGGDTARLQYLLERGWLRSSDEAEELIAYAVKINAGPVLLGQLHSFADKLRRATDGTEPDAVLCLDHEAEGLAESVWTTSPWASNMLRIEGYCGPGGEVRVPDTIGGRKVGWISGDAFDPYAARTTREQEGRERIAVLCIPGTMHSVPCIRVRDLARLERVELGEGVREILPDAFFGALALREVVLPSTLKHVCSRAFGGCPQLEHVQGLHDGLRMDEGAFGLCRTSRPIDDEIRRIRHAYMWRGLDDAQLEEQIREARARGESGRFERLEPLFLCIRNRDAKTLRRLIASGRVKDWYDAELLATYTRDMEPDIREQLEELGRRLPRENGPSPEEVYWVWRERKDGTLCLTSYEGPETRVEIPAEIAGRTVTAVEKSAFETGENVPERLAGARRQIHTIVIPGTIRNVPGWFALNLPQLKIVRFENGVRSVGEFAFGMCSKVTTAEFPATLERIEDSAFRHCGKLNRLSGVPAAASIGENAFEEALGLTDPSTGLFVLGNRVCAVAYPVQDSILLPDKTLVSASVLSRMPPIVCTQPAEPVRPPSAPVAASPGDRVLFGVFPQDSTLVPRPLEWVCVAREGEMALLVTVDVITTVPVHVFLGGATRATRWLRDDFARLCVREEDVHLLAAGTGRGPVSVPTASEVRCFMPRDRDRVCGETDYARCRRIQSSSVGGTRRAGWMTLPEDQSGEGTIIDCETGAFYLDDGRAFTDYVYATLDGSPFGVRPWLWLRVPPRASGVALCCGAASGREEGAARFAAVQRVRHDMQKGETAGDALARNI